MSDGRERHRRAGEIFAEAIDQPESARATYLDRACEGDQDLRAMVERLIAADAEDDGSGIGKTSSGLGVSLLHDTSVEGRTIGDYRIVRVIGQGGMGTVYLAEQENPRRQVAIKVIRSGIASTEVIRRFEHEAQILAQLQHPGIATVHDAGTHDDGEGGRPYFAMEYVDGVPMTIYADEHLPEIRDRLEMFARVCDAVHHAHQKGVIHRDLKPENILVTPAGDPKILDFGVARVTDDDLRSPTIQTSVGQLIGTLSYMSPEQVSGRTMEVDTRSDVYALGVVLFELLSGQLPHGTDHATIPEMIRAIHDDDGTHLSSIDSRFRGDIETIVAKATEKTLDRRYGSAADLAADIRRYLNDEPIAARPASRVYRLRKFTRRNKALVFGVTATMLAIVGGGIAALIFAIQASQHAARADWSIYCLSIENAQSQIDNAQYGLALRALERTPDHLHNWEYGYLLRQLGQNVNPFDPTRPTWSTFWPDGTPISVGHLDDTLVVINARTGTTICEIGRDDNDIRRAFDEDGQVEGSLQQDESYFVVSTPDPVHPEDPRRARGSVWDTRTGVHVRDLDHPWRSENTITRDGSIMADWSRDDVRLVDLDSGEEQIIEAGRLFAGSAVQSHDGSRMAITSSHDDVLWLVVIDLSTGEILRERREHRSGERTIVVEPSYAYSIAWNTTDSLIALDFIQSIEVLAADTLETVFAIPRTTVAAKSTEYYGVAFKNDVELIRAVRGGRIALINVETGVERTLAKTMPPGRSQIAVSPDRRQFMVGGRGSASLHYFNATRDSTELVGHSSFVYCEAWSPDGRVLATAAWDGTVRLWNTDSGETIRVLHVSDDLPFTAEANYVVPSGVQFSQDGRRVTCVLDRWDRNAKKGHQTWDLAEGTSEVLLDTEWDGVLPHAVAGGRVSVGPNRRHHVSHDASLVAYAGYARTFIYDRQTGAEIQSFGERPGMHGHANPRFNACGFSQDDRQLATVTPDGTIELWDVATGERRATSDAVSPSCYSVAFSPDGTRLVVAGREGMYLLDADTLDVMIHIQSHDDYVTSASFSPDGTRIASVSGDMTARLYDCTPIHERRQQFVQHEAVIEAMTPIIDELFEQMESGGPVWDAVMNDPALTEDQRAAARLLLINRTARQSESSAP